MLTNEEHACPTQLSRAEVLDVLDREIRNLSDEKTRHGWSNWGILLGLAGMAWALLRYFEDPYVDWRHVALIYVNACLIIDVLLLAFPAKAEDVLTIRGPRFHQPACFLTNGPATVVHAGHYVVLMTLACLCRFPVSQATHVALLVAYIGKLLIVLAGAFMATVTLPLLINRARPTWVTATAVVLVAVLYLMLPALALRGYANSLATSLQSLHPADARAAVLCLALVYLLLYWSSRAPQSPLIRPLKALHRELSFCHIAPSKAARQAEALLLGMQLEQVLQEELAAFAESTARYVDASRKFRSVAAASEKLGQKLDRNEFATSAEREACSREYTRRVAILEGITSQLIVLVKRWEKHHNRFGLRFASVLLHKDEILTDKPSAAMLGRISAEFLLSNINLDEELRQMHELAERERHERMSRESLSASETLKPQSRA